MSSPLSCSVVIATLDRTVSLAVVLDCLRRQTRPPVEVIIAGAGDVTQLQALVAATASPFPITVLGSVEKSSARQRNLAAAQATGDVIAFLDDDIEFGPELFAQVLAEFSGAQPNARPAAVSPRISNGDRRSPGRLVRAYFRLQAGYADPDYGARLFGAGLNCFPVYQRDGPARLAADWLPSTCLFVRTEFFRRHQFPQFTGYSFAEDVHLTGRIAREAPLYFLREPVVVHHSLPSEFKSDLAALTAGKLHNMAVVAREVQGLRGWSWWWRWQLHRLFMIAVLSLRRTPGWTAELRGVIAAKP
ncbi:MAG: glycosyltransferase family A protein [Candidatus Didemnitutus sp.]|nr:glycosyltransferase family A protein [Candidatus Didemnitutus sp.]